MEGMEHTTGKRSLASSWEQLEMLVLLRVSILPSLVPVVLLGGLYVWYVTANQPISSTLYSIILFVVYLAGFIGLTLYYERRLELTRAQMSVLMGFSGLLIGLLVAVAKLVTLFETWGVFRLLSEPVFTALLAGIIGSMVLWGKRHLPSNHGDGIV